MARASVDNRSGAMPAVRFHRPTDTLKDFVTSFYVVEAHHALVDHLHPEWGNIRLLMRGGWQTQLIGAAPDPRRIGSIYGPTDRTRRLDAARGLLIGIGLTPLGWSRLFDCDAASHANQVTDLDTLLGISAPSLIDKLGALPDEAAQIAAMQDLLESRLHPPGKDDATIRAIHARLIAADFVNVADLAASLDMRERTLHRACLRAFGFPPMRLLRRQRFLRALDAVTRHFDQPVGEVLGQVLGQALGDEYYDQSHFNREFRRYMGMTPLAYFRSPRAAMRRAAIERQRLIGASLQGLHPAPPPA